MIVAVEISLLSYTQAEIKDLLYVLPVNGSHVIYTSHSDVGVYLIVLLDPEIIGVDVEISLLSYTHPCTCTSG
jgi:hypothetical protein